MTESEQNFDFTQAGKIYIAFGVRCWYAMKINYRDIKNEILKLKPITAAKLHRRLKRICKTITFQLKFKYYK